MRGEGIRAAQGCSLATDAHHNLIFKRHRLTPFKCEKTIKIMLVPTLALQNFAHTHYTVVSVLCTLWYMC